MLTPQQIAADKEDQERYLVAEMELATRRTARNFDGDPDNDGSAELLTPLVEEGLRRANGRNATATSRYLQAKSYLLLRHHKEIRRRLPVGQ
jgi:hypothetical protein